MLKSVKLLIDKSIERQAVRREINLPEDLKAVMLSKGVPIEPKEIEGNRIQTRWVMALALLVAFVGILNAMLMSVTERFREIGTMKCLGALDGFIVKLFLLESLFQGTVGTLLGIIVGLGVSFGMAALSFGGAAFYHVLWDQVWTNVLITLLVGMVLSVGGAILPALQAARMEPIAAMRVDA
ncbi:MAG: FtsX-like permease family protein [Burkholderiales bacterium]|nr:FtsX-like permease family protein [Phycisphaerae bacterium]